VVLSMDVDFDFTVTRLAKIANTNNLSGYGELWSSQIGAPHDYLSRGLGNSPHSSFRALVSSDARKVSDHVVFDNHPRSRVGSQIGLA
jgi:hypothetical protein